MSALLVSFLNVVIVIVAIVLAVIVGSRKKAILNSLAMVLVGVAAYVYDIYEAVSSGQCAELSDVILELVVGVSGCIGIGGKQLIYAQILILAGFMVLAFQPLKRLLEKEGMKDNDS